VVKSIGTDRLGVVTNSLTRRGKHSLPPPTMSTRRIGDVQQENTRMYSQTYESVAGSISSSSHGPKNTVSAHTQAQLGPRRLYPPEISRQPNFRVITPSQFSHPGPIEHAPIPQNIYSNQSFYYRRSAFPHQDYSFAHSNFPPSGYPDNSWTSTGCDYAAPSEHFSPFYDTGTPDRFHPPGEWLFFGVGCSFSDAQSQS
jgi:hypothetical protein